MIEAWKNKKPYFTNPEGFEWYLDPYHQTFATIDEEVHKGLKDVVCFVVKKGNDLNYIMIDKNQNVICDYKYNNIEGYQAKIKILKVIQSYDEHDTKGVR